MMAWLGGQSSLMMVSRMRLHIGRPLGWWSQWQACHCLIGMFIVIYYVLLGRGWRGGGECITQC